MWAEGFWSLGLNPKHRVVGKEKSVLDVASLEPEKSHTDFLYIGKPPPIETVLWWSEVSKVKS
jgi:hypothetical protein